MKFNVAGDMEINDDIPAHMAPKGLLHPRLIKAKVGLLAEEYYDKIPTMKCRACGSGAGNPISGELGAKDGISEDEGQRLREAVADDVVNHGKRGEVPKNIRVWADEHARRVAFNWKRELMGIVRRYGREIERGRLDSSWSRMSRRNRPGYPLKPGNVAYRPRVSLLVDTSGSMESLGPMVLGFVDSVLRSFSKVTIISCDAEVYKTKGKQFVGGGGTDLRPGFARAEKDADLIIAITDGETPWPNKVRCPAVIVTFKQSPVPSWATKVSIGDKNAGQ